MVNTATGRLLSTRRFIKDRGTQLQIPFRSHLSQVAPKKHYSKCGDWCFKGTHSMFHQDPSSLPSLLPSSGHTHPNTLHGYHPSSLGIAKRYDVLKEKFARSPRFRQGRRQLQLYHQLPSYINLKEVSSYFPFPSTATFEYQKTTHTYFILANVNVLSPPSKKDCQVKALASVDGHLDTPLQKARLHTHHNSHHHHSDCARLHGHLKV